ncbi:hypothetical protein TRVL_04431 [Trypanosoma vivax]|nr:hypothetical protein TRVL_04431 [Trypanosoma vivax]
MVCAGLCAARFAFLPRMLVCCAVFLCGAMCLVFCHVPLLVLFFYVCCAFAVPLCVAPCFLFMPRRGMSLCLLLPCALCASVFSVCTCIRWRSGSSVVTRDFPVAQCVRCFFCCVLFPRVACLVLFYAGVSAVSWCCCLCVVVCECFVCLSCRMLRARAAVPFLGEFFAWRMRAGVFAC